MKKIVYLLALVIFIAGCATAPYNACVYDSWNGGYLYNNYSIEIISEPSGAKIEVDNNYIGETPLQLVQDGLISRWGFFIITAHHAQGGQFRESKMITLNKPLPRKIYFNMNKASASDTNPAVANKDYNINANQQNFSSRYYNYAVSGYNSSGDYVYGEIEVDQSGGNGYIYNDEGDEVNIDVDWTGYGTLEGYDYEGNYYELEVDD